jgi:hypothetical protein
MKKEPTHIYAVLAYSPSLNVTKRIFDEDALLAPYNHTIREAAANQKAAAFAQQMNDQRHKGATDWVPKIKKQEYKPSGIVRAADIKWPRNIVRGL